MAGPKLSLLLLFITILLLVNYNSQESDAGPEVPYNNSENSGMLNPEDIDVYIPGAGKVTIPTFGRYNGGGSRIPRKFLPGIDNTFLPNPGYEIPIPYIGGFSAAAQP